MEDHQILRLRDDLDNGLKSQHWARQIQGAPQCVILMAECKLLVSKSSAMTLDLSGCGLRYVSSSLLLKKNTAVGSRAFTLADPRVRYESLYANIGHCTQIGQDTLKSTAERMERVEHLAREMSGSGGIVESILKYVNPAQSTARDKQLQSYIMTGQNTIAESVQMISEVRQDFLEWRKATTNLLLALQEKASTNTIQQKETERKLQDKTREKSIKEEMLEQERQELLDFERRYQRAFEIYENIVNNLPSTIASTTAITVAAAAAGLTPAMLAAGIALGSINYIFLESRRKKQTSTVQDLMYETSSLRDVLVQLSGEEQSIAELATIIKGALEDLNKLQEQIDNFMEFLIRIQKLMKTIIDNKDRVFRKNWTLKEREELLFDGSLKEDIQRDALLIKNRFLVASKVSAVYNEVSDLFVIPGVRWLSGFNLINSSDEDIEEKLIEIEKWKARICKGADELIITRSEELRKELENLNRDSIESLNKAAPEFFQKTMGESEELNENDSQEA